MQVVKSSVAGAMITRLKNIRKEIVDMIEDVEILSDANLMRAIEEREKDFENISVHKSPIFGGIFSNRHLAGD